MSGTLLPMDRESAWKLRSPTPTRGRKAGCETALSNKLASGFANTCYFGLRLTGWLAVTLLATFGIPVLFFMMVGDFTATGFFAQVANLAKHFAAADTARRAAFMTDIIVLGGVTFAATALIRAPALIAIVKQRKGAGDV